VAEPHVRPDLDKLLYVGPDHHSSFNPERLRRTPEQSDVPGWIGSR
jgi:hypothetical protein